MKSIAILCHAQVSLFELACAVELFALPRPELSDWYHSQVIRLDAGPAQSTAGLQLQCQDCSDLMAFDVLVIPSWPVHPRVPVPAWAEQLRAFYRAGKQLLSFCSGSFLLAELGLLDGRRATTHWRYADAFQQRFPQVEFVADVLYVDHHDLACSAGSAAALDLGLAMIRRDYGQTVANQVARRLVLWAHREGDQRQCIEAPVLTVPQPFAQALNWAQQRLAEPILIDEWAAKACMSRRSFDRKFQHSFGMSPKAWLIQQRLQRARELLEHAPQDLEGVAQRAGFESVASLRYHFRQQMGMTPGQYRGAWGSE